MKRMHAMPFGANVLATGGVRFALWAPGADRIVLEHGTQGATVMHTLTRDVEGWHRLELPQARAGDHYRYRLADGLRVPDPASRFNPDDVHGASEIIDPHAYEWRDQAWRGRAWEEAVIYELHVGTFTPQGTFAAAQGRLAELAAIGITAIELMPVADFPGQRNWGYDGVLLFAPDACYGRPEELKAFVDASHDLGLMVLLDVVYNHFGPEGNYLHAYCPQFFNPQHETPWGAAVNFDGEGSRTVREFYVHNALYWIEEYHFDGLRLDAIHAIRDDSPRHIVREIAAALNKGPGRERPIHLVLENDANEARYLERDATRAPACASAQWNDDLHHAAHVLATGECDGYYADYADAPLARFGRALAEGFVYQGEPSPFRGAAPRGEPSTHLPPTAFVSFLQTHDQVGNRAFGERLHAIADAGVERTALACLLLSPHIPMLFMGEEFAASTPFLFFCDFEPELAKAVTEGRRHEFERFAAFSDASARARIPDPGSAATFEASKLRWSERGQALHRERLALTRELLALRHRHVVPHLHGTGGGAHLEIVNGVLRVEWLLGDGTRLQLLAHFGADRVNVPKRISGELVYCAGARDIEGDTLEFAPGAVHVVIQSAR
ncbi:MAG: malto-oligosyltrehalose trehalohydrolase [Betaproteobacteria bacterium]